MWILTKEDRLVVDGILDYFLRQHKLGNTQQQDIVCGHAVSELRSKGYDIPSSYVENRWIELTSEWLEKKQYEEEAKAKEQERDIKRDWKLAKPKALRYMKGLPEAPPLDMERARKVVDEDLLSEAFVYNGRALELDFPKKRKGEMRKLEDMGIVKVRRFPTKVKAKNGGQKPFIVFYWEPTGIKPAREDIKSEEYDVYSDDELWNRANGGRA